MRAVPRRLREDGLAVVGKHHLREQEQQGAGVLLFPGRDGELLLLFNKKSQRVAPQLQEMGQPLWLLPGNHEFHQSS
jgi:hypothetical protein